jgi:hypothetical protein
MLGRRLVVTDRVQHAAAGGLVVTVCRFPATDAFIPRP